MFFSVILSIDIEELSPFFKDTTLTWRLTCLEGEIKRESLITKGEVCNKALIRQ